MTSQHYKTNVLKYVIISKQVQTGASISGNK